MSESELSMPAIPEKMQKMRDAVANLLRVSCDEGFIVVGVLFSHDGETITMQNTKDDFVKLLRATADMAERKLKNGSPIIRDDVRRMN